jgi:hypothetical protein
MRIEWDAVELGTRLSYRLLIRSERGWKLRSKETRVLTKVKKRNRSLQSRQLGSPDERVGDGKKPKKSLSEILLSAVQGKSTLQEELIVERGQQQLVQTQ